MGQQKKKEGWKLVKFWINLWIYENRIKRYAQEEGISISDVLRIAINHFFKDKPY